MTSSSSFDVLVTSGSTRLHASSHDLLEIPCEIPAALDVSAVDAFFVEIRRPPMIDSRWRVRLGSETIGTLEPGSRRSAIADERYLLHEFGESELVIEQEMSEETGLFELVFKLPFHVVPRDDVVRDYRVMIEDVARVHEGLAYDVLGRTYHDRAISDVPVMTAQPEPQVEHLGQLLEGLEAALAEIADQPSRSLDRKLVITRYRGGDRVSAASIAMAARDENTRIDSQGRVLHVDRLRVMRPIIHTDIPEHRQMAAILRQLHSRGLLVANHCERAADLVRSEEARWGGRDASGQSVFQMRQLPRVRRLEELASQARHLAEGFAGVLLSYDFLRNAGQPRRPFGPTPVFMGRPAYKRVFELLQRARQSLGFLVDGDSIRVSFRNLATLYEYWCFIRLVDLLKSRFGAPQPRDTFSLIDAVYRPELTPGQEFRFTINSQSSLLATYEPSFHRGREARDREQPFAAAFTKEPLRPDITLEVRRSGQQPVVLALDAKASSNFRPRKFREISDYSRQVYDWRTGYQPIRQVFLLHRDRHRSGETNIPRYLQGRTVPPGTVILGAVPCIPEHVGVVPSGLTLVVSEFLRRFAEIDDLETARSPSQS